MNWSNELKKYLWAIALACVVVVGYSIGKDAALRDNMRDTQAHVGGDA